MRFTWLVAKTQIVKAPFPLPPNQTYRLHSTTLQFGDSSLANNLHPNPVAPGSKATNQSRLASRKSSQVPVPSERHHFQDLRVTPEAGALPKVALPARLRTPPWPLSATLLLPADSHAIAHTRLGHAGVHSLTLPLRRRGPPPPSPRSFRGSRDSATELNRVGVAQTRLRGSARPPARSQPPPTLLAAVHV